MHQGRKHYLYSRPLLRQTRLKPVIIDRQFQYRHALSMSFSITLISLLFFGFTWFFLKQNYNFFVQVSLDNHPKLVNYIEREFAWLTGFMVLSVLAISGTTMYLILRMTSYLLSPIVDVEKNLRRISQGSLKDAEVEIKNLDEYNDIAMTYDFFYRKLKSDYEHELELLEKLVIDPRNREAHHAWTQLIELKRLKLGVHTASETSAKTDEVVPLRRVS